MMLEFCPPHEQLKLEEEFWHLKQIGDDNLAYTTRFKQLSLTVPHLVSTPKRTKYINGLPPAMRDSIEADQLDTIEEVYALAASLNNNRIRDKQFANSAPSKSAHQVTQQSSGSKNKRRKSQGSGCNAIVPAANVAAKPAAAAPITVVPEVKKQYTGSHPRCATCNFHHPANSACRLCTNYNRYSHTTQYCRQANPTQQAQQAPTQTALPAPPTPLQNPRHINVVRACYKCGYTTHLRNQCPQLNQD
ncbi:putative transcription factor interactor and regulator CCHC(Zn) family [Helianthus anomalus]